MERLTTQKLKKKHDPHCKSGDRTYGGNILTSKAAHKYRQAWRIYRHYHEIYCKVIGIQFYKE